MEKITIKDIAKMAGVSPTLVSFVINNKPGASPEKKEKILEIIRETGFSPNISSRRLTMHKSFNVCMVVRGDLSFAGDFFYSELTQGLLVRSKEHGYNLVISDYNEDAGETIGVPDIIQRGDADGVIFYQRVSDVLLHKIRDLGLPAVLIDYHRGCEGFACVNADYAGAAYKATRHLIENGHRDIALLSSNYLADFHTSIFTGFCNAMDEASLSIPLNWLRIDAGSEEMAYASMEKLLAAAKRPTAVMCAADMYAVSAMRCVKDRGLSVPEDMSFIGIDDIIISKYIEPPLTTIRIDKKQMAERAMDLLMDMIDGQPAGSDLIASNQLVVRKTVKSIAEAGR